MDRNECGPGDSGEHQQQRNERERTDPEQFFAVERDRVSADRPHVDLADRDERHDDGDQECDVADQEARPGSPLGFDGRRPGRPVTDQRHQGDAGDDPCDHQAGGRRGHGDRERGRGQDEGEQVEATGSRIREQGAGGERLHDETDQCGEGDEHTTDAIGAEPEHRAPRVVGHHGVDRSVHGNDDQHRNGGHERQCARDHGDASSHHR